MTRMREVLRHSNELFQVTNSFTFNPKCVKMGELYGEYNQLTSEWKDGLASTIIRTAVADATPARKWVVFDGPVDAIWIENMNTVSAVRPLDAAQPAQPCMLSSVVQIDLLLQMLQLALPSWALLGETAASASCLLLRRSSAWVSKPESVCLTGAGRQLHAVPAKRRAPEAQPGHNANAVRGLRPVRGLPCDSVPLWHGVCAL